MSDQATKYRVVFHGAVHADRSPQEVKEAFAKLLKKDAETVEKIFNAQRTIIKSGLDRVSAEKYWSAFDRIGAVLKIEPAKPEGPEPSRPAAATPTEKKRRDSFIQILGAAILGGVAGAAITWVALLDSSAIETAISPTEEALGVTASVTASVEENELEATEEEKIASCQQIAGLAETVMTHRQQGTAMSDVMNIVKDTQLGRSMVIAAYDISRYATDDYQQRAIEEFRDEWNLQCLKALVRN